MPVHEPVINAPAASRQLRQEFPDAEVTEVSSDEVIAELIGGGVVVMVGPGGSMPHFHLETTEVYQVVSGKLAVIEMGGVAVLEPGGGLEGVRLLPKRVHSARSIGPGWARFNVTSIPSWTPSDHFIA